MEAMFSDSAWHSEPSLDQAAACEAHVSGTLKVHVSSDSKQWPCYTYDDVDDPTEWTILWPLGSHFFAIDHDTIVIEIAPDYRSVPELSFDRELTPESDADFDSVSVEIESNPLLDLSKRERMDVEHDKSSTFASVDWLGVSLLPGISVMDRGRPVRKSSAACWPGVGRTHPSEALEEWRPRKEY